MNSSKIFVFFVGLFALVIWGCASNQPPVDVGGQPADTSNAQNQAEIDQLFNIINQSEAPQQDKAASEDEVLQLLGIKKDQKEKSTVEQQPASTSDDQLKKEIDTLEQQLADKEAEIANLKSSVAEKDKVLDQLETQKPAAASASGTPTISGNYKQDYQAALQEYYNRNYKTAIKMFEELLAIDSSNSLADNARYWIGECYYGLGNYDQAIIEFTKVFSFTKSNKMADAQLKIGLCYFRLGDRARAAEEFERLINDYPDSEYVGKAREFLAKIQ
ncbi:MAG: tetratricopeptide repeat protein [Calditrichaeota bacterium]|nr:tetratricopeptide repeat protein [Calditrichota bacterium]